MTAKYTRTDHSDETKQAALKRYQTGESPTAIAQDLGIKNPKSIFDWLKDAGITPKRRCQYCSAVINTHWHKRSFDGDVKWERTEDSFYCTGCERTVAHVDMGEPEEEAFEVGALVICADPFIGAKYRQPGLVMKVRGDMATTAIDGRPPYEVLWNDGQRGTILAHELLRKVQPFVLEGTDD